jgi:hypothetical protein
MDWLDEELRKALGREDPPPGFADRVLLRTRRKIFAIPLAAPRWFAAAAALILVAGGAYGYRWHQGMQAKREVMLAFRITSEQVSRVQSAVKGNER